MSGLISPDGQTESSRTNAAAEPTWARPALGPTAKSETADVGSDGRQVLADANLMDVNYGSKI